MNSDITILERIIAEDGSCTWSDPQTCNMCPFSKLTRSDDGSPMSCVEAFGIEHLSEEQADARYKEAALQKLAEIALEKGITET